MIFKTLTLTHIILNIRRKGYIYNYSYFNYAIYGLYSDKIYVSDSISYKVILIL